MRLGFAALLNMTEEELEQTGALFKQKVEQHNETGNIKISVSTGFAAQAQYDLTKVSGLAKLADKEMYEQKALYYSEKGIDRRKKQEYR